MTLSIFDLNMELKTASVRVFVDGKGYCEQGCNDVEWYMNKTLVVWTCDNALTEILGKGEGGDGKSLIWSPLLTKNNPLIGYDVKMSLIKVLNLTTYLRASRALSPEFVRSVARFSFLNFLATDQISPAKGSDVNIGDLEDSKLDDPPACITGVGPLVG